MAAEGALLGEMGRDARRLILARMVIDHRLSPKDPLAVNDAGDDASVAAVLSEEKVGLEQAQSLLSA